VVGVKKRDGTAQFSKLAASWHINLVWKLILCRKREKYFAFPLCQSAGFCWTLDSQEVCRAKTSRWGDG